MSLHHIGIIPDGNRRWAKANGVPLNNQHEKGMENIKTIIKHASTLGVKYITMFALSVENVEFRTTEINPILDHISVKRNLIDQIIEECNAKINFIGQFKDIKNDKFQQTAQESIDKSANNDGIRINFALNYSGKQDIVNAVKSALDAGEIDKNQSLKSLYADIESNIKKNHFDFPDIDLVIRTGNKTRISNFCLWQLAYAEVYFSEKMWPEFTPEDFDNSIAKFANSNRTFGK